MSDSRALFFMHIPKSGGTTLNNFIESKYDNHERQTHIERFLFNGEEAVEGLRRKKLLTGHVRIAVAFSMLGNIPHRRVTMFRNPNKQTLSHLSWVDRLRHSKYSDVLARVPDYIKNIVERMDKMNIVDFISNMDRAEKNLFDNSQTRYLLATRGFSEIDELSLNHAVQSINSFDAVGINEQFNESVELFCAVMGWEVPAQLAVENRTEHFVGKDVDASALSCAISSITAFDQVIYRHAVERFQQQKERLLAAVK